MVAVKPNKECFSRSRVCIESVCLISGDDLSIIGDVSKFHFCALYTRA